MSVLMQSLPFEVWVMVAIGFVSLIAVAMPMYRGVRVVAQAWAATRFASAEEIRGVLSEPPKVTDPLGLVMVRVLGRAQDDNVDGYPAELLRDASRQYVINEYEVRYAEPIAMYANILPPIGFIGTTVGMLVLFVSLHLSDGSLQIGALGIALCSTIFALLGLATLEHCKIGIYNRLLRAIDAAMNGEFETSDEPGSPVKPELAIVT